MVRSTQAGSAENCDLDIADIPASSAGPVGDRRPAPAPRRTPYGPRAETRAHPHGLTRRERVVLELLAAGNRDADIATALGIRPKTASNHVGAILAKLGVRNRTQAAAYAETPSNQRDSGVAHADAPTVSPT
jgi:DNA-binding NarL/FixJ family response regulator